MSFYKGIYIYNIVKMTRKELIKELAKKSNLTHEQASNVLTAFINIVTWELVSGRDLTIRDLGKFKISKRKSRNWVNPRTWESLVIPSMWVATFSAWAKLKAAVKDVK